MLRPYQVPHSQAVMDALLKHGAALDASDTGTGKTYAALAICKVLGAIPLVVGTKSARAGWEAAAKTAGVEIEYINYEKCRPTRHNEATGRRESDWTEQIPWGKGSFIKWKSSYYLVIFDEVHRCGGSTSLNSKLLIAAKRQAQYVLALSATAADDPRQMKALGYALGLHDLSKKGPPSRVTYMSWLMRHGCTPGVFGGMDFSSNAEKQRKAFTRLNSEIFPHRGARMRKVEIPGFPKTVVDVLLLSDETGKAEKVAEELHDLDEEKSPDLAATIECRMKLEHLKVPHFIDKTKDCVLTSKVAIFVNFTDPLFELYDALRGEFGNERVGYISGAQQGKQGEAERFRFLREFQENKLDALVCNIQAGGESANMHDPTGQVERTTLISPCESGKQFKQVLGRVNRDSGAYSLQLVGYFKGTREEVVADRMKQKSFNIDLLNDADLLV